MRTSWTRRDLLFGLGASALAPLGCREEESSPSPAVFPGPFFESGGRLPWRNWAGSQVCVPTQRLAPTSEEELAQTLRRTRGPIRPVGAGHSFSPVVPTDGTLVSLDLLSGVIETDPETLEAEVWGGTRLFELGPALWSHGQAMPNLPDIDQQAVAGAVATSTHGTGTGLGSLSSYLAALTVVGVDGRVHHCSREHEPDLFDAARTSLGALGVVTRLRLRNRAAYNLSMEQRIRRTEDTLDDLERLKQHRHFELFAIPGSSFSQVIIADETTATATRIEAEDPGTVEQLASAHDRLADFRGFGRWVYDALIELGSEPLRRTGPAFTVLPNLRMVRFNEMEYTIPAESGPRCMREILAVLDREPRLASWPIEYRYVRADDVWLSPFYLRDGCSISLHQPITRDYRPFFDAIEPIFRKYEGRPHWGKLHSLDARQLAGLYPRWSEFQAVRRDLDPMGRLLNPYLRRLFGA